MSWAYQKVVLAETDNVLRFSPGKIFCFNIQQLRPARSCWMLKQKIFPGFFKKNSHATWQASNSRSPLQPPLQSCNWKGVNVPNMNGCFFWRPMGTTRKKQLWSWGAWGIPRLNLQFYRMAVFYEEPGMYYVYSSSHKTFRPIVLSKHTIFLAVEPVFITPPSFPWSSIWPLTAVKRCYRCYHPAHGWYQWHLKTAVFEIPWNQNLTLVVFGELYVKFQDKLVAALLIFCKTDPLQTKNCNVLFAKYASSKVIIYHSFYWDRLLSVYVLKYVNKIKY